MRERRSIQNQVRGGLRLAGLVLLACVAGLLMVWGGLVVSHKAAGSTALGWLAIAVAFLILVLNLPGCVRALPGFLILAALNALTMAASGHVLDNPSATVSRGMALGSAAAFLLAAVVSARFDSYRLSLQDRVVVVLYVGLLVLGVATGWGFVCFILGAAVLASPWLASQLSTHRKI